MSHCQVTDPLQAEQSVFESQPKRSSAEVPTILRVVAGMNAFASEVSHGEAAKPADAAQSTFESQPQQPRAEPLERARLSFCYKLVKEVKGRHCLWGICCERIRAVRCIVI